MEEKTEPIKSALEQPTPEVDQLLKLIQLQTEAQRQRRPAMPRGLQGEAFRWGSLVVIVAFAVCSIIFMEWLMSQLPKPPSPASPAPPPSQIAAPATRPLSNAIPNNGNPAASPASAASQSALKH